MNAIASQITSLTMVRGIHQWPVSSPQKWPVTKKMFPFDDIIMRLFTGTVVSVNYQPIAQAGTASMMGFFVENVIVELCL